MATLFEKIWNTHQVARLPGCDDLIYIDLHLIHEVTSPQAFDGLRIQNRKVRRPERSFATMDHNVPTLNRKKITDPVARAQMQALEKNCQEFGITLFDLNDRRQGIVHVIGPELGLTLPGQTIVCGDSHTSTHGAFGALAFGIGTSEVEHVLATQCLILSKPKSFAVEFQGKSQPGVTSKDYILKLIGKIGTAGATGTVLEYTGAAIGHLSMEARMTICNMSIEAGARAGLIAPDEKTVAYLSEPSREFAPKGDDLKSNIKTWQSLFTDKPEDYDRRETLDLNTLEPQITWGTSPGMVTAVSQNIPNEPGVAHITAKDAQMALEYMGLKPAMAMQDITIDVVFIGSCTNSRIEDLRQASALIAGRKVASHVEVLVVPGSTAVQIQAEKEGLDKIFLEAGCQWRDSGCSMCLAMNPDQLKPQQRAVSTSNRNFEGRQGKGGRTHLASPLTAAASAIRGKISDPREFLI